MNEILCKNIQTSISLWKDDLETVIENNEILYPSKTKSYYWLGFDGIKYIISMNLYEHLKSEKTRMEKKRQFLIDPKQNLCEHVGLHPMITIKGKYIIGKI